MSTGPFADEDLPEGAVVDASTAGPPVDEAFDFVVVGTGAAGAVAAHRLTESGFTVAMVEEGPWVKTRDFGPDVYGAFNTLLRDAGTQVIQGRSFVPMLQGRCVGGSTVINSAIAWRTPDDVLEDWGKRFGLVSLTAESLAPHFDALEEDLNVHAADEAVWGENNRRFLEAAEGLGFPASPMRRYERGCKGSGRCLTGCPHAAKQGMNVSYVPWALHRGARIVTSCRVQNVIVQGGRAVGVVGQGTKAGEGPHRRRAVTLRARLGVLVAASTVQTPNLLRRSGVRSPALGRHFQAHPGVGLVGLFDDPVNMQFGATQGAESIHFRLSHRFKPETLSMQPELAAVRVPGMGRELVERLALLPNLAVWAVQVRARAEGRVDVGWDGRDRVRYTLLQDDVATARRACGVLARMMFQAGAREVWPGIAGQKTALRSVDEVPLLEDASTDPRAYSFVATHLFGAARMGVDPKVSVVGPDFAVHGVKGLYVVDSSVFPTNLGVNPQHSIMGLSRLAASRIAEGIRRAAAA